MFSIIQKISARLEFIGYGAYSQFFSSKRVIHKGHSFLLGTSVPNEVHRAFTFSSKEPETLDWIDRFEGKSPVLFDVGANIGIYSLYAQQRWPDSKIISFEPESQSYASLCRNIFRNRWGDGSSNITPFQMAIAKTSHIGFMSVSSMRAGAGASALGNEYQFLKTARENIFKQGIAAASLDDLVGLSGMPQPNYVKIDVDGLESEIIAGAMDVIRSPDLRGLLVEFQYRTEADLAPQISQIESAGLALQSKSEWQAEQNGLFSRNFIFVRH